MMHRWERVDAIIDRVEQTLISIFLSVMILIALLQIVLRNLFATGLTWGDPLVRNLVLWVGFIGAAIATREGKHISIDVVSQWVPSRRKVFLEVIIDVSSFIICGLLTFAAVKFIRNEALMGTVTFLGIRAWLPELILPITFGLMTLRFGFRSLKTFL
ncbi:MAG TPA: TRAP transporter small permease [Thermodesulfobacteriota bacterium]|jgi:TRAP-type C4-dicarboxylate transport system permease small subunit